MRVSSASRSTLKGKNSLDNRFSRLIKMIYYRINAEVKEDIERQEREGLITIAPVFPERRDFDFLLLNKFET